MNNRDCKGREGKEGSVWLYVHGLSRVLSAIRFVQHHLGRIVHHKLRRVYDSISETPWAPGDSVRARASHRHLTLVVRSLLPRAYLIEAHLDSSAGARPQWWILIGPGCLAHSWVGLKAILTSITWVLDR